MRWNRLEKASKDFGRMAALNTGHNSLTPEDFQNLAHIKADLRFICEHIELARAFHQMQQFENTVEGKPCSYHTVDALLENLWQSIQQETDERRLALIPPEKAKYFEQEDLFGETVSTAFPSAKQNIKNAGNCLASDLHTAAVYHLMSVAEMGLRSVAKQLRVKTVRKAVPLELGTWEDVIRALESKVNGQFPRSKKGQQESDFYKGLFVEFRAFKDLWRNKVMHVRISYDSHQAQSAFDHVCAFMQRLAERVSE
jgi:hypothetical protein